MQYLYADGELYYFMDLETYEQIPLNYDQVEDALKFLDVYKRQVEVWTDGKDLSIRSCIDKK